MLWLIWGSCELVLSLSQGHSPAGHSESAASEWERDLRGLGSVWLTQNFSRSYVGTVFGGSGSAP